MGSRRKRHARCPSKSGAARQESARNRTVRLRAVAFPHREFAAARLIAGVCRKAGPGPRTAGYDSLTPY